MIDTQKIINTIKYSGPVIPSKIAKAIGTDIIMASAVLSELLSSKKIKISNLKVGGSPVYYLPGQESKLQQFEAYLNEKDQKTVNSLKQRKIIRDSEADPLTRVSLRQIKDFAVPLNVTVNGNKELFWKWYLVSGEEVQRILNNMLNPKKEIKQQTETKQENEIKQQEPEANKEIKKQENETKQQEAEANKDKQENEIKQQEAKVNKDKEIKRQENEIKQQELQINKNKEIKRQENEESKRKQDEIKAKEKEPVIKRMVQKVIKPKDKNEFFKKAAQHFSRKDIEITKEVSKKRNEIDYIIKVPSSIGNIEYFCRIKDKKRVSDSDLDAAFAQGQIVKLPILLVISGELTKKAREKLKDFKNIIIKKL